MIWPIVTLVCLTMVLGTCIYLAHLLWAVPRESARNAELLHKLSMLEAKLRALDDRPQRRPVQAPFSVAP